MKPTVLRFACLAACLSPSSSLAQTTTPQMLQGMSWRNIGPFRAGRVSAVTGVIGQPGVFYMGLPMGGVWKTTGAGTTWIPIFDSVKEASSVGSIEVAPSDPNVIYVGMGDMTVGGSVARGNGVYKSTDGGSTWTHLGLDKTERIPSLLVDPRNPNMVLLAASGSSRAKSPDRGVYRSADGGRSWTKTLYVDEETGAQKIAWAFDRPDVMLATTIRSYSPPGQGRGFGGGFGGGQGPSGTRLYKSTDRGLTWKQITGGGLPSLAGKTSVAIAIGTDAKRMFIVGNFGLYRSDDGGETWKQMAANDRRVMNGQGGYNCGVYVNSQNPDVVYVVNTCLYRSTDGGKTFTGFKGAPGGDDPQQMWIDPTDGKRIFLGMDQGATVTLDGGETWSSWYNQPTGQYYHISADTQYPYWVYGTEQDSGSIGTSSRGNLGAITMHDWLPHPGYEFGSIVADPLNPKVTYAGGPSGGFIKTTYPSGQWIDVSPSMDATLALRKVTNQPLLFSPKNPRELLAGFQCVMTTVDGGRRWKKLSPDLTARKGETPPASQGAPETSSPAPARPGARRGGKPAARPVSPPPGSGSQMQPDDEDESEEEGEGQRPGGGAAIESIAVSSVDGNVLWAGTSNGLVHVSRDHGATWEDVTPPDLPNGARADISAIDASHQEAGAAYIAVDCHNAGDYRPYLYRTRDFGKTWTPIVAGLPTDEPSCSFARVIRADTQRAGLLFAGTESSVYVSFDDGDHWQSLALNLPNTSYRDLVVKGSDLIAGTYGRAFWVLDDISPLRQIAASADSEPARLFKPGEAIRVRRNVGDDTPFPPEIPHADNPPPGVILYYSLATAPAGDITIEIKDAAGTVIRHYSSAPIPPLSEPPPPVPDFWLEKPQPLPKSVGLNRINWNLRYDSPPAFSHGYEINANPGQTPASPEGPLVLPGAYTVTLTVDGKKYSQTVTVRNDPRSPASMADLREQHAAQMKLYQCARESWDRYHQVADTRASIAAVLKSNPPEDVAKTARDLDEKLSAVGGSTGFGRRFGGFPGAGGPPRQPTFAGLVGTAVRHLNGLDSADLAPTETMKKVCAGTCAELLAAIKTWEGLKTRDLVALNALLAKNNLKQIAVLSAPGARAQ